MNLYPPEPPQPAQLPLIYVRQEPCWEYKILSRENDPKLLPGEEEFNELGQDGWELTGVHKANGKVIFYFKRMLG